MLDNIKALFFLAGIRLTSTAAMATDIHCEGHEDTLKIYLGMHQVLFMERDTTRVAEFYAPEVISHNRDEGGSGVTKATHETLKAMWENSKARDPDRVLINDLIRSRVGYLLAYFGTRLLSRSRLVHVDGPLSVAAALTCSEALRLADRAGLKGASLSRHWPERFLLSWRKA